MEKVITLLEQRRVWAAVVGIAAFTLTALNVDMNLDVPFITDQLTMIGIALANLLTGLLALWSYLKPKTK